MRSSTRERIEVRSSGIRPKPIRIVPAETVRAEDGLAGERANDIDPQRLAEFVVHLAEHLVRLADLDPVSRWAAEHGTPEPGESGDVDAGDEGGAHVHRHAVGLLMVQGGLQALLAGHGRFSSGG